MIGLDMIPQIIDNFCRFTPSNITRLTSNQIFVFGTDLKGSQKYGAAGIAKRLFGAQEGISDGLSGRSYAIPTKGNSYEGLYKAIERFIEFAKENADKNFLVTPIGCGHAGFSVNIVAPLFVKALDCNNIYLPISFIEFFRSTYGESNNKYDKVNRFGMDTAFPFGSEDDNRLKPLIDLLQSKNVSYNIDGTFTLKDVDNMVIGEAEIGIESLRVVVNPVNSPSLQAFKNAGYKILDVESAIKMINNG